MIFWCILLGITGNIVWHNVSISELIKSPFLFANSYWFVRCYLIVFLLSPIINKGLASLSKKKYLVILVSVFLMLYLASWIGMKKGTELQLLLFIYILGRFMVSYGNSINTRYYIYALMFTLLTIAGTSWIAHAYKIPAILKMMGSNYSPLTLIMAMSIVHIGLKYRFFNHLVNYLFSGMLSVYIIHENDYFRNILWSAIIENSCSLLQASGLVVVAMMIFLGCELIRKHICSPFEDKLIKAMQQCYHK